MALPSNVTFGTVVGTFLLATADSPDDPDRDPQGIAATDLKFRFTPDLSSPVARDASATPPVMFALQDVTASVGADGSLIGPDGAPGVRLVASTNPVLQPTGWTWRVVLSGPGFPNLTFSFQLDAGATVDLTTVVQVPANPGGTLNAWLQAVADANAARDAAVAAAASIPSADTLAVTYLQLRSSDPSSAERAAGVVAYLDRRLTPPALKGWDGTGWVVLGGDPIPDNTLTTDTGDYLVTDTGDYLIYAA